MIPERLKQTLRNFKLGKLDEDEVIEFLRGLPYEDLDFAKVDHHRALRHGFPEVIFGRGKTVEQILKIAGALLDKNPNLLITSAGPKVFQSLKLDYQGCKFYSQSGLVAVVRQQLKTGRGKIGVFSAGTADIPVAEEAMVTAQTMGNEVCNGYDLGVAGVHRILSERELLDSCSVVIVVAGMEGALPSVVGGLVNSPVIAVPTSIGYGASFGGLAALLGMLNSCSANVAVVNIDNGFGAGYIASLINRDKTRETGLQ